MKLHLRVREAEKFFRTLYGSKNYTLAYGYHERLSDGSSKMGDLGKLDSSDIRDYMEEEFVNSSEGGLNVFYTPTPMKNGARSKDNALPGCVVYGDADKGLSDKAFQRLKQLDALLVRSGGTTPDEHPKYHVYLPLSRTIEPDKITRLNRALRDLIDGDKYDCSAYLRIPGTRNHKYDGAPIVRVSRWSKTKHEPDSLALSLGVDLDAPDDTPETIAGALEEPEKLKLQSRRYNLIRPTYREWNRSFKEDPDSVHRYAAMTALVRDAIRSKLTIEETLYFANRCKPLVDKQETENGYSIEKDLQKVWIQEGGKISPRKKKATPKKKDDQDKDEESPIIEVASGQFVDLGKLLSGNWEPPEPSLFPVGDYGLLYPGRTHTFFGESDSGKTMLVLAALVGEMKRGKKVLFVDFEGGLNTIVERLHNDFGLSADMLSRQFHYLVHESHPEPEELSEYADREYDIVVIDGINEAISVHEGSSNDTGDVIKWYREYTDPFTSKNSAVVTIDHTNKTQGIEPRRQMPGGAMSKKSTITGAMYFVRKVGSASARVGALIEAFVVKDKDSGVRNHALDNEKIMELHIDPRNEEGRSEFRFKPAEETEQTQDWLNTLSEDDKKKCGAIWNFVDRATNAPKASEVDRGSRITTKTKAVKLREAMVTAGYLYENVGKGNAKFYATVPNMPFPFHTSTKSSRKQASRVEPDVPDEDVRCTKCSRDFNPTHDQGDWYKMLCGDCLEDVPLGKKSRTIDFTDVR